MSRNHRKLNARTWAVTRHAALLRASFRCESCGKAGRLEVHHVTALADGGDPYALDNVTVRCRPCHFSEHAPDLPPDVLAWRDLLIQRVS